MGGTELYFWYRWDFFGLNVEHYIAMLAHTIELTLGHYLKPALIVQARAMKISGHGMTMMPTTIFVFNISPIIKALILTSQFKTPV